MNAKVIAKTCHKTIAKSFILKITLRGAGLRAAEARSVRGASTAFERQPAQLLSIGCEFGTLSGQQNKQRGARFGPDRTGN